MECDCRSIARPSIECSSFFTSPQYCSQPTMMRRAARRSRPRAARRSTDARRLRSPQTRRQARRASASARVHRRCSAMPSSCICRFRAFHAAKHAALARRAPRARAHHRRSALPSARRRARVEQ